MGDLPVADISDNRQKSQETDIHAAGRIRTQNPSKQAAADPRLRPQDHRDLLSYSYSDIKKKYLLRTSGLYEAIPGRILGPLDS